MTLPLPSVSEPFSDARLVVMPLGIAIVRTSDAFNNAADIRIFKSQGLCPGAVFGREFALLSAALVARVNPACVVHANLETVTATPIPTALIVLRAMRLSD